MARFSSLWDEAEHPRDRLGRFRSKWKIGGKAKAIVDSILDRFQPRQFPDYQRANNYGVERGWSRYTPQQKKSITDYTRLNSRAINAELRTGKQSPESKSIDEAMHPLEDDIILTRSLGPQAFGLQPTDIQATEELTGKLISDHAYTNAWMGGPARNGGVTMHILAPRGTPAVFPGGAEVMLGRGQPLRVTRAEQDGAGGMRLFAVAVPASSSRTTSDLPSAVHTGRTAGNLEAAKTSSPVENIPERVTPDTSIPERIASNPRAGEITPPSAPARSLGDTPSGVEADGRPSWTVNNQPIVVSPAVAGGGGLKVTAGNRTLVQDAPDLESLSVEASRAGLPEVSNWAKANQRYVNSKDAPAAADRAAKRAVAARQLQAAQEPEAQANAPETPSGNAPGVESTRQTAPSSGAPAAAPSAEPTTQESAPAPQAPVVQQAPVPSSAPQTPVDLNQPESPNATPEERAARAEVRRNAEQDAQAQGLAPVPAEQTGTPSGSPETTPKASSASPALAPTSESAGSPAGSPARSSTSENVPSTNPVTTGTSPQGAKVTPGLREKASRAGIEIPKKATKQQAMDAIVEGLLERRTSETSKASTARKVAEPQKTTLSERESKVREAATRKLGPARAVEPAQKTTLAEREAKVANAPSKNLPPAKVAPKKKTTLEERTKNLGTQREQDLANDAANKEQRDRWSESLGGEPKGLSAVQDLALSAVAEDLRGRKTTRAKAADRLRDLSKGYKDEGSEQNKYLRDVADLIEGDTSKLPPRITKPRAPKAPIDVEAAETKLAGRTEKNILTGIGGLPVGDVRALAEKWGIGTRNDDKKLKLKADLVREMAAKWRATPSLQRKKEGASSPEPEKTAVKATSAAKAVAPEVSATKALRTPTKKAVAPEVSATKSLRAPVKKAAPARPASTVRKSSGEHSRADLTDMSPSELKQIEDSLGIARPSLARDDRVQAILDRQQAGPVAPAKRTAAERKAAFKAITTATPAKSSNPEAAVKPSGPPVASRQIQNKSGRLIAPDFRSSGDEPLHMPNHGNDQGLIHMDSEIGELWQDLTSDRRVPNSYVNEIARMGDKMGRNELGLADVIERLKRMKDAAPDKAVADRIQDAVDKVDAPPAGDLHLPSDMPAVLRKAFSDLADIPTARVRNRRVGTARIGSESVLDQKLDVIKRLLSDTPDRDVMRYVTLENDLTKRNLHEGTDAATTMWGIFEKAVRDPTVKKWLNDKIREARLKVAS